MLATGDRGDLDVELIGNLRDGIHHAGIDIGRCTLGMSVVACQRRNASSGLLDGVKSAGLVNGSIGLLAEQLNLTGFNLRENVIGHRDSTIAAGDVGRGEPSQVSDGRGGASPTDVVAAVIGSATVVASAVTNSTDVAASASQASQ